MKTLYFKKLDTLRFVAFALVFWSHAFANLIDDNLISGIPYIANIFYTGGIGVHIFFVLSGFLITYLLLQEQKLNNTISIKNFYIRRVLRIWPLYYLILTLGIFILPAIANTFHFCGDVVMNLTFLNNFDIPESCHSPNTVIAWSVAVEEQFYLVWPILFFLLRNKLKSLFALCSLIFALSTSYIFIYEAEAYYSTWGNLNYLMAGCMGAILYFSNMEKISSSKMMAKPVFRLVLLAGIILILFKPTLDYLILSILYTYIVLYLVINNGSREKPGFISILGKYTYGMYMFHPLIIVLVQIMFDIMGLDYKTNFLIAGLIVLIALLGTILLSVVSYNYFEKFFLKYKSRFAKIKTRL